MKFNLGKIFRLFYLVNGLFQKKSTHPQWMGFWKFSRKGGGAKTLEIQAGGGVELEKVFCMGSFQPIVHAIRTFSSVTLKRSQTLKIVEIFCLHISHLT